MFLICDIMNTIDDIDNSDSMTIISIIGNISFVIGIIRYVLKKRKIVAKHILNRTIIRDIIISVLLIFCGLLSPIYLLYKSFMFWDGWVFWVSQVLSWSVLSSFIMLAFMVGWVLLITKKPKE
ncbi:MAG: hypothetical protein ABIJ97_01615 [Bacteroidota bacterium]